MALLRGETSNVYISGSDVNLNLLPLISQVLVWVDERLPGGLSDKFNPPVIAPDSDPAAGIQEVANWSGKPLPSDFGQITLLQSDALGPAQTAVKWFDRLTWILPFVTVVLIALTIWLSRRRARTAIAIGIGAAVAIFVTRVIIKRASLYLTDKLEGGQGVHVVKDVVNASLGPLTTMTIWICVIGVVAALLVWLLGRRDVRAGVVAAGKRVTGQSAEIHIPDSPVTSWVVNHVVGVRWGVLVVGLIVLALVASSWLGIILSVVVSCCWRLLSFMTGSGRSMSESVRRDVRAGVVAAGKRVTGQSAEIHIPDSPVTSWVVNHVVGVRWGVLVVGLIVLALVASSWLGIILAIVVVLLLEGFLSFLTGQWPFHERESDEAPVA